MTKLYVVETVFGTWFYHLSENRTRPALCGYKETMPTECRLESWGYRGHLKERYCKECEEIARSKGWLTVPGA